MLSFEDFVLRDGSPIYAQILLYIHRGVASGRIRDGDELPSRRVLSALLGVNPNTVQKAYRMLEEEGLISSHAGAKSLMVIREESRARIRTSLVEADAKEAVHALKELGITREEAAALLEKFWNSEELEG